MENQHKIISERPIGFWIFINLAIFLNIIYLLGQTMAIISYDFAVAIDLQEPASEVTAVGVALNKGFGFGDTVFYIPIFIMGIVGLVKRSTWGVYAMTGAMAITVYWPIVSLSTIFYAIGSPGYNFTDYTSFSIILPIISLYGLWGLWFVYNNRDKLVQ